jgi:hypothetical protein
MATKQKTAVQKLYVAQALGIGEREDTFYNIGVYTSRALALVALEELAEEMDMELERNVEEFTLNA